jgi:hypothetical protein
MHNYFNFAYIRKVVEAGAGAASFSRPIAIEGHQSGAVPQHRVLN